MGWVWVALVCLLFLVLKRDYKTLDIVSDCFGNGTGWTLGFFSWASFVITILRFQFPKPRKMEFFCYLMFDKKWNRKHTKPQLALFQSPEGANLKFYQGFAIHRQQYSRRLYSLQERKLFWILNEALYILDSIAILKELLVVFLHTKKTN